MCSKDWRGDGSIVAIRSGLGSSHQIILIFSIGFALLSTYTAPGPRLIVLVLSFVERRYLSPGYSYFAHVCYYHTRLATIINQLSTLDRLVFSKPSVCRLTQRALVVKHFVFCSTTSLDVDDGS